MTVEQRERIAGVVRNSLLGSATGLLFDILFEDLQGQAQVPADIPTVQHLKFSKDEIAKSLKAIEQRVAALEGREEILWKQVEVNRNSLLFELEKGNKRLDAIERQQEVLAESFVNLNNDCLYVIDKANEGLDLLEKALQNPEQNAQQNGGENAEAQVQSEPEKPEQKPAHSEPVSKPIEPPKEAGKNEPSARTQALAADASRLAAEIGDDTLTGRSLKEMAEQLQGDVDSAKKPHVKVGLPKNAAPTRDLIIRTMVEQLEKGKSLTVKDGMRLAGKDSSGTLLIKVREELLKLGYLFDKEDTWKFSKAPSIVINSCPVVEAPDPAPVSGKYEPLDSLQVMALDRVFVLKRKPLDLLNLNRLASGDVATESIQILEHLASSHRIDKGQFLTRVVNLVLQYYGHLVFDLMDAKAAGNEAYNVFKAKLLSAMLGGRK